MALQEQLGKIREAGPRAVNFLGEVWAEMKKVQFPTRQETYAATVVVLVVVVIVATYLGVVDFGVSHLVQWILS